MCLIKEFKVKHEDNIYLYQAIGQTKARADWMDDYINKLICCSRGRVKVVEIIMHILNNDQLNDNEKILAIYVLGAKLEHPLLPLLCSLYEKKCNNNDPPMFS